MWHALGSRQGDTLSRLRVASCKRMRYSNRFVAGISMVNFLSHLLSSSILVVNFAYRTFIKHPREAGEEGTNPRCCPSRGEVGERNSCPTSCLSCNRWPLSADSNWSQITPCLSAKMRKFTKTVYGILFQSRCPTRPLRTRNQSAEQFDYQSWKPSLVQLVRILDDPD